MSGVRQSTTEVVWRETFPDCYEIVLWVPSLLGVNCCVLFFACVSRVRWTAQGGSGNNSLCLVACLSEPLRCSWKRRGGQDVTKLFGFFSLLPSSLEYLLLCSIKLWLDIFIFLICLKIPGFYNALWHTNEGEAFCGSKYHRGFCDKCHMRGQGNPFQLD